MNLDQRKSKTQSLILLLATILFYGLTVFPHETVGRFINSFFKDKTRAEYDQFVFTGLIIAVIIFSIFIIYSLYRNPARQIKGLLYLSTTVVLCFVSMKMLTVINIEAIHFLQYGVLAILIFHLVNRYDYSCWIIFFLGFVDESYQHFFLTPNPLQYLDFNDMVLDQIGGGFGLSTMYCLNKTSGPSRPLIRNGIIAVYVAVIIAAIVLYFTGTMRIWPTERQDHATIQIFQRNIEGFWQTVRKVNRFHIMRAWEGLIISFLLILFYSQLDEKAIYENQTTV